VKVERNFGVLTKIVLCIFELNIWVLCVRVFQAETEMECVEAALKPNFRKDLAMKLFPQAVLDEAWAVNGQNGAACDDFFVDELLDLSNEDGFVKEEPVEEEEEEEEEEKEEDKGLGSVSAQQDHENSNIKKSVTFSAKDEFGSVLSVPVPCFPFPLCKKTVF